MQPSYRQVAAYVVLHGQDVELSIRPLCVENAVRAQRSKDTLPLWFTGAVEMDQNSELRQADLISRPTNEGVTAWSLSALYLITRLLDIVRNAAECLDPYLGCLIQCVEYRKSNIHCRSTVAESCEEEMQK